MFTYKNTSRITKTFHGVTFNPGDVHSVSGYINDPKFIRVKNISAVTQKPAKSGGDANTDTAVVKPVASKSSNKPASQKSQASDKKEETEIKVKEDDKNG